MYTKQKLRKNFISAVVSSKRLLSLNKSLFYSVTLFCYLFFFVYCA